MSVTHEVLFANLTEMIEQETTDVLFNKIDGRTAYYDLKNGGQLLVQFNKGSEGFDAYGAFGIDGVQTTVFFGESLVLEDAEHIWKNVKTDIGQHLTLKTDQERALQAIFERACNNEDLDTIERNGSTITFNVISTQNCVNSVVAKIDYFEPWHHSLNFTLPVGMEEHDVKTALQALVSAAEVLSGQKFNHLLS